MVNSPEDFIFKSKEYSNIQLSVLLFFSMNSGEIICEAPNNTLDKFRGTLYCDEKKYSLDNDKILLRVSTVIYSNCWTEAFIQLFVCPFIHSFIIFLVVYCI